MNFILSVGGHNNHSTATYTAKPTWVIGCWACDSIRWSVCLIAAEFAWITLQLKLDFYLPCSGFMWTRRIRQERILGALNKGLGGDYNPMHTQFYCLPLLKLIWVFLICLSQFWLCVLCWFCACSLCRVETWTDSRDYCLEKGAQGVQLSQWTFTGDGAQTVLHMPEVSTKLWNLTLKGN